MDSKNDKIKKINDKLDELLSAINDDEHSLADEAMNQAVTVMLKFEKSEGKVEDNPANIEIRCEGSGFMMTRGFIALFRQFRKQIIKAGGPFAAFMLDNAVRDVLRGDSEDDDDDE